MLAGNFVFSFAIHLSRYRDLGHRLIAAVVFCGLLLVLFLLISHIRGKRIRVLREVFEGKISVLRGERGQNQLLHEVGKLRAAEIAMRKTRARIRNLAPVVPPIDKDSDNPAELCERMRISIEQNLGGIAIGSMEVALSEILADAGYPLSEQITDVIEGVRQEIAENPENPVEILEPLLMASTNAASGNGIDAAQHFWGRLFYAGPSNGHFGAGMGTQSHASPSDVNRVKNASFEALAKGIPIVSLMRSFFRESGRAREGKISIGRAAENITTDVVTTGAGGLLGAVLIPIPFVGTTVGAILARLAGKHFKTRRWREAHRTYSDALDSAQNVNALSIRQAYRAYRDMCLDAHAFFVQHCGNVILPSEAPEIVSFVTEIRVSLLREEDRLQRELERCIKSVLDNHTESMVDRLCGLSVTGKTRHLLEQDAEDAFVTLSSMYPRPKEKGLRNLKLLEQIAGSSSIPKGPLERCLMQSSGPISRGLATQLRAFAHWCTIAMALRDACVSDILKTLKEQSERHTKGMEPVIDELKRLAEKLRREAEAL